MQSHANPKINKKTQKRLKKLSVWIKKIQNYKIFEIGKNSTYDLSKLMLLPIFASLNNTSVEYESTITGRPTPTDFYHHMNNKLTEEKISSSFSK